MKPGSKVQPGMSTTTASGRRGEMVSECGDPSFADKDGHTVHGRVTDGIPQPVGSE